MRISLLIVATMVLLAACDQPESLVISSDDTESAFTNDDERVLYTLGVRLGMNIEELALTDSELDLVAAGMRDAVSRDELQVDINVYGATLSDWANQRIVDVLENEKIAAAEFSDAIAAEPGAERSPSGLVYVPVTSGDGEMPDASDRVRVHYRGTLRDGSEFDSSRDGAGEPVTFALSGVIPCWTEGVQKMRVGETAKLLCPSDIAYGDGGVQGIPGGAALLFEVELLEIVE